MDAKAKKRQKERRDKIKRNEAKKREVVKDTILKFDAPELKSACSIVNQMEDLSFIDKMKKVISFTENGVGLSANQIGITKKVFVIRPIIKDKEMKVFINPEIIEIGKTMALMTEGCLSYPDFYVDIERPMKIKLKYYNEKFIEKVEEFSDYIARIIQHEQDHLLGICKVGEAWEKTQNK